MPPDIQPPVQTPVPNMQHQNSSVLEKLKNPWLLLGVGALVIAVLAAMLFLPGIAPKKRTGPIHIGIIQYVKQLDQVVDGFKLGMTELGYTEGKDIVYEYQNANGDPKLVTEYAKAYVGENVDLMLTITSAALEPAWQVTQDEKKLIPIVFTNGPGLVESGFLKSYQSSGTNVTGSIPDDIQVTVKKLEFMKQIQPNATKVGVFFGSPSNSAATTGALTALREQAPKLGLTLVEYPLTGPVTESPAVMQKVADSIKPGDVDAFVTVPDGVSGYQDNALIEIGVSKRLKAPVYFLTVPRVAQGGLLSYSQDYIQSGKQAAAQADKILKGAKPQDLPIETSQKNYLLINLKTAKEMGLTIPESILFVADKVIPAEAPTTPAP